jgi:hypothetical protein
MASLGSVLVATSPGGPGEPVGHVVHGLDDKHREQGLDLDALIDPLAEESVLAALDRALE